MVRRAVGAEAQRARRRAVEIVRGVMGGECKELMQRFFRERRLQPPHHLAKDGSSKAEDA